MILFGIIVWLICSIVTSGMVMHIFPEDWYVDDAWAALLVCIMSWPLLALFVIAHYILMKISLSAIFAKGFLDAMSKKEQRGESNEQNS